MVSLGQGFYVGEFRHNLDAKKRLTVPSKWRFEGDENNLYLAFPDPAGCITVYPPAMVDRLREQLSNVSIADAEGQLAITSLLSSADSFTFDKNGRINLHERLYQHSGVEKEVVLVGTVNKFSLWSPERYDHYRSQGSSNVSEILQRYGF